MKFIFSISSLIISGILIFTIAKHLYHEVSTLKTQNEGYIVAIDNFNNLIKTRDKLMNEYRNVSTEDKDQLERFLPHVTNNLKFILEVENIANNYNLPLRDIKFTDPLPQDISTSPKTSSPGAVVVGKPYLTFPVEFTVDAKYDVFAKFLYEVEHNLRLIDIKSISFDNAESDDKTGVKKDVNIYNYKIKIETYGIK